MSEEREFQGVWIPSSVWSNAKLSWLEKCLIAEIDSLSGPNYGPCNASSESLAERMGSSPGSIRNMLSRLSQEGFLIQLGSDGRRTWRCVAPEYTGNFGKFRTWLSNQSCNPQVAAAVTAALQHAPPPGYTEKERETASENLRSYDRTPFSQKNSEHNGFSATPKMKKKLTVEYVLEVVRFDITLHQSLPFRTAWKRWLEHRLSHHKGPPTLQGLEEQMRKCARIGEQRAVAAIRHSMASNWLSIYEEKETAKRNTKPEPSL